MLWAAECVTALLAKGWLARLNVLVYFIKFSDNLLAFIYGAKRKYSMHCTTLEERRGRVCNLEKI